MKKLSIFALSAAAAVTMTGMTPATVSAAVSQEGNAVIITGNSLDELKQQFQDYCAENGVTDWKEFLDYICQNGAPILPPAPDQPDVPDTDQPDIPDTDQPDVPDTDQPDVPDTDQPDVPDNDQPDVPAPDQPGPDVPDNDTPDNETEADASIQRIVDLVNEERAKEGLAPLTLHSSATAAAAVRAKEIKTSFSHTRPDGRNFNTALNEQGVSYRGAGENIAYGQRTPEEVMTGWMNSSGHRANIMNGSYTSIGVGHYVDANGVSYWTQLFLY